ncbi:hypothetical protein HIM_07842 [Hirsutella minnesotensis 3608]|uniref:Carrier domain-containing protein n=1 Tax=Hirsutella minnesotensis 3608 TaxID=1043627 RepID=A0A0F7ZYN2_9HYPO|nr:hypothetical protein HIM_07842 [Hirsutella minnesotensis 3608]
MALNHELDARWQDDLLPHIVDRLAEKRPDAEYAHWVKESDVEVITYSLLANIVDGLAWWIVDQLGPGSDNASGIEVLAYMGPNDVRYPALILAAIKAGYVLFLTSPRNSADAQRTLFNRLRCKTLLTSDPAPPAARVVLEAVQPQHHLTVPSVEDLMGKQQRQFVLTKTYHEIPHEPFLIMHTSGTTGMPQPITWAHRTCAHVLNSKAHQSSGGCLSVERELINGKRVMVTLPPFHGAFAALLILGAIPYGSVMIIPVATALPTGKGVVDALMKSTADAAVLVPSVVAELAQSPDLLETSAQHLESIIYIGGDLPQDLGDRVAEKLNLRCLWGATETGIVPQLLPPEVHPSAPQSRRLWQYIRFHPCVGANFQSAAEDVYELVLRRDSSFVNSQPCFTVEGLEQLREYRTKDLFQRHPTIPDLWCWRARADDIIVFLNGEKTNPISMEQHIMANNPELSGALVVGAQRFQAALFIEPKGDKTLSTEEQAALIEHVWQSVEEANQSAPAHARVEKSFILVVSSDRPLVRSGKGTFVRSASISQYAAELDALYDEADSLSDEHNGILAANPLIAASGLSGVTQLIRNYIRAITGWIDVEDDDNLFDLGMDSLQGLRLSRALRKDFQRPSFALATLYQNPTIAGLAAASLGHDESPQAERRTMEDLLATYQSLIELPPSNASLKQPDQVRKEVDVLMTGSTGTVGTYLLKSLLERKGINRIFCLNRGPDGGKARQNQSFEAAGFETHDLDESMHGGKPCRVTFLTGDLQRPQLGLDPGVYESLQSHIGLVIHAAWAVNFNMPLVAFRPQLVGLANLLRFSASQAGADYHAKHGRHFVFISSVSAVGGYRKGPPPEQVIDSLDTPEELGYARSKFLGELLVNHTMKKSDDSFNASIIRLGQVAGPVRQRGLWNPKEWFPSMIKSSIHLGQIPDDLGPLSNNIDFVPVDLLADILMDLVTHTPDSTAQRAAAPPAVVLNVRNPHQTLWSNLLPIISEKLKQNTVSNSPLMIVSPQTWFASLRACLETPEDEEALAAKVPAIKLLGFFEALFADVPEAKDMLPMAIDNAMAASPAMRALAPVGSEWITQWMEEWMRE